MRQPAGLTLALLLFAAPAFAQRPPAPPEAERLVPGQRDGFIVDATKGCWLWMGGMPARAEEMAVTWTGTCPQGPAEGEGRSVLSWREGREERQMIYEGPLRRGKAQGRGRLAHFRDGEPEVLEAGDYADDYLVSGRIEVPAVGLVYEGAVQRGRPNGRGRLTLQGRVFEGEWQQGCLAVAPGVWIAFGRSAESCETEAS
jgi:hypothetical protein